MSKATSTALFYLSLAALGVALYKIGHIYATAQRGYVAYGGEILFLLLPLYAYITRSMAREIKEIWKGVREAWQKNNMPK